MTKLDELVYIKWCDATSLSETWITKEEAIDWADNERWVVESVGFLLKETKEYVLLSSKKSNGDMNNDYEEQYGLLLKIPKTWIRERTKLKGDK